MAGNKRLRKIGRRLRDRPQPHKRKRRTKSLKQKQLEYLYVKQRGICAICHQPMKLSDSNIDHIIPKSQGGRDSMRNYQATHILCNTEKGDVLQYSKK